MRRSRAVSLAAFAAMVALGTFLIQPGARAQEVTVLADTMTTFWGGGQGAPPALIDVPDAQSPKCVGNFFGGAWAEFPVKVDKAGWYKVSLEHGADAGQGDSYITLDTRAKDGATHYVTGPQLLPNSGGWTTWVTTDLDATVPLRAGDNVLRVQNIAKELRRPDIDNSPQGGVNLTAFKFAYSKDLEALGTISGTVSSSDLKIPVGFARVTTGDVATPHDWWIKDWWTKADDKGAYTLEVPAATYTLTAFRPDTYRPNKATGVKVDAGQTTQAPEIQLQSNWTSDGLKQYSRDIDSIIPGGATGFYDETRAEPVEEGEDIANTRIVTGWWEANDWTEQLVDVPETGWYRIVFEYSTGAVGPVNVRYSANGTAADSNFEGNGNWREYLVTEPDAIPNPILLVKGTNRLRLTMLASSIGFNESFHILTKTTGPAVGTITGKVLPADGKTFDPTVDVVAKSSTGNSVGIPDANGNYSMYAPVGTYTLTISDILGRRTGAQAANVEVKENQTTTAPDLTYRILPFFIGVDPARPASRPADDDFPGTTLASKWTKLNLGDEMDGDAQAKNGVLETTATQVDFWGNADSGHYVYQKVSGDFIAYVKLLSIPTFEEMGDWSKHGLMARLSEEAGSAHFTVLAGSGRRTITEWRAETDGATASGAQPNESYQPGEWLRLIRKGGDFTAAWSYNDQGTDYNVCAPVLTSLASFANQKDILLGLGDTTGLSAVSVPATATYSTFRVIPYDEAMANLPPVGPVGVKGDVNANGKLEITDVVFALRFVANLATPTDAQKTVADVNANGRVDITDVLALLRAVAGITPL